MAESELKDRLLLVADFWLWLELLQADTVIQSNNILAINDWLDPSQ